MPQNTRDIKRRITSTKSTAQITKAMEMVAAAKLRRVQEAVQLSKPYLAKMVDMLSGISKSARWIKHPLLANRPVKKTGYLVITGDRGLAGPYNSQIIRQALLEFRDKSKDEYVIFAVGRRGRDFFRKHGYPLGGEVIGVPDLPTYANIRDLAETVVQAYDAEEFDELYMIYNEFVNPVTQVAVTQKVLPLSDVGGDTQASSSAQYLFEPDAEKVFEELLPRYAETLVYQAVLDSKASFHAAQMNAMGNATDAASDMIDDLTLQLNRARQSAITTQIVEIAGGAEALK